MENQSISFTLNDQVISGELSGTSKLWQFKSVNSFFKELYPNGLITSHMIYTEEPSQEQGQIFNLICDEIDKIESHN